MQDVIAKLEPSLGRRWFGAVSLCIIAVLILYISFAAGELALAVRFGLIVIAGLCLWQVQWNLRVTRTGLYLTAEGLFDGQNNLICPLDNMVQVDPGLFAFKPSNGFLIHMREPESKSWAPGLYWRFGRRLGVGGATKAAQAKAMAEMIDVMINERSMGPDIL